MSKGIGYNLRVQLVKMWDSHVRWHFIYLYLFHFFISLMFFFLVSCFLLHTMDEHRHKMLVVLIFALAMY